VARITRKEMKTDKFALEVGHTVDFFEEHNREVVRYGAVALAVAAIVVAIMLYRGHLHMVHQEALAQALQIQEAPVGTQAQPGAEISFPTQDAKDKEAAKAFSELASKYSGTDEGYIAEYYLGCLAADQAKLNEAEKRFQSVADSANKRYASLANLALGQVYFAEGKNDQGEKLLRSLIDHPTVFVSKDQATVTLAKALAHTKPAEARKLLDPLRAVAGPVSQTAIQAYSELPPQ
jgi:predicted negative regulator of RcsB-dependent stress response